MLYGTVKHYDLNRGFGFISRDDRQPDQFFHINEVEGRREPSIGDRVAFDIAPDRKGRPTAVDVRQAD